MSLCRRVAPFFAHSNGKKRRESLTSFLGLLWFLVASAHGQDCFRDVNWFLNLRIVTPFLIDWENNKSCQDTIFGIGFRWAVLIESLFSSSQKFQTSIIHSDEDDKANDWTSKLHTRILSAVPIRIPSQEVEQRVAACQLQSRFKLKVAVSRPPIVVLETVRWLRGWASSSASRCVVGDVEVGELWILEFIAVVVWRAKWFSDLWQSG